MKITYKKGIDVKRVVAKITITVLTLYVGGTILTELGKVMNETESVFYPGLELIGWTVGAYPKVNATNWYSDCAGTVDSAATSAVGSSCITGVNGTGILTVIGLVGVASIVMEFVSISF